MAPSKQKPKFISVASESSYWDVTYPHPEAKSIRTKIPDQYIVDADAGDKKTRNLLRLRYSAETGARFPVSWKPLRENMKRSEDQSEPVNPDAKKKGRPPKDST